MDDLAKTISNLTASITGYLRSQGVSEPSFADGPVGYPLDMPPNIAMDRMMLIEALMDLHQLASGQAEHLLMTCNIVYHSQSD
jgi:hypothetical protein